MIKRKCKITFIRHGSTVYTDGDILNDDCNYPPLNELGRIEMEQISKWVQSRGLKVDKIYSSDSSLNVVILFSNLFRLQYTYTINFV